MYISADAGIPASILSNFAAHELTLDGVKIRSMEGFLQSLKFKRVRLQVYVCGLIGRIAKMRGRHQYWQWNQTLYWMGKPILRNSPAYRRLINRAYNALAKNEEFRSVLLSTGDEELTHRVGKSNPTQTVLTEKEFASQLMRLRKKLQKEIANKSTRKSAL